LNDESILHSVELENLAAAIDEANSRLKTVERDGNLAADREQAEALRIMLIRFTELDMKPTQVGGDDVSVEDSAKALAQLNTMAETMRAKSPDLTIAQCFARIFTDSANAELAAKAHRRPRAEDTGNYPYPTTA
jgi:hypothetical protein